MARAVVQRGEPLLLELDPHGLRPLAAVHAPRRNPSAKWGGAWPAPACTRQRFTQKHLGCTEKHALHALVAVNALRVRCAHASGIAITKPYPPEKTKAARRRGFGEPQVEFRKSKEDKEGIVARSTRGMHEQ